MFLIVYIYVYTYTVWKENDSKFYGIVIYLIFIRMDLKDIFFEILISGRGGEFIFFLFLALI